MILVTTSEQTKIQDNLSHLLRRCINSKWSYLVLYLNIFEPRHFLGQCAVYYIELLTKGGWRYQF